MGNERLNNNESNEEFIFSDLEEFNGGISVEKEPKKTIEMVEKYAVLQQEPIREPNVDNREVRTFEKMDFAGLSPEKGVDRIVVEALKEDIKKFEDNPSALEDSIDSMRKIVLDKVYGKRLGEKQ